MNRILLVIFLLLPACSTLLQAESRHLSVLVFADQYRYGLAGFELAGMLSDSTRCPYRADFTNTGNSLTPECLARYDVLVLFNHNDIDRDVENNITRFVRGGGGLVALHHVLNHGNNNPELTRLVGGYYLLNDSSVQHHDFKLVRLPGVSHPVFEGVPESFEVRNEQDFTMRFYPGQNLERILSCDIPWFEQQNDSGWTRSEGSGRIIYLSPGDPVEESPFLRNKPLSRLIINAVGWAGRDL
jgi:uncharacterized protein